VMLNLIVAVILENFTSLGSVNPQLVSRLDIGEFSEAWGRFDPDADGWIPTPTLPKLVRALKPPLGVAGTKDGRTHRTAVQFCLNLGITQQGGQIEYKAVLDALISANYVSMKVNLPEDESDASPAPVREMLVRRRSSLEGATSRNPSRRAASPELDVLQPKTVQQIFAYDAFERYVKRRRAQWAAEPSSHPSQRAKRRPAAAPVEESAHLPANWYAATCDGQTYYYNAKTKEVTWTMPEHEQPPSTERHDAPAAPPPAAKPAGSSAARSVRGGAAARTAHEPPKLTGQRPAGKALPQPVALPPPAPAAQARQKKTAKGAKGRVDA